MIVAEVIREAREARGLSRAELGATQQRLHEAGWQGEFPNGWWGEKTVAAWEEGQSEPRPQSRAWLRAILGLAADALGPEPSDAQDYGPVVVLPELPRLQAARERIADPAHWCQGAHARAENGRETAVHASSIIDVYSLRLPPTAWSLLGAYLAAGHPSLIPLARSVPEDVRRAASEHGSIIGRPYHPLGYEDPSGPWWSVTLDDLQVLNDLPGMSHAALLGVVDTALAYLAAHPLTTEDAAHELGVTPGRVRQLVGEGRLAARKVGRDLFIDRAALAAVRNRPVGYPAGRPRTPPPPAGQ